MIAELQTAKKLAMEVQQATTSFDTVYLETSLQVGVAIMVAQNNLMKEEGEGVENGPHRAVFDAVRTELDIYAARMERIVGILQSAVAECVNAQAAFNHSVATHLVDNGLIEKAEDKNDE